MIDLGPYEVDTIVCGDCLDVMRQMPDGCVDLVVTDPPSGRTVCDWDSIVAVEPMWGELKRVIRNCRAVVVFAMQPFTSQLILSNVEWYKYSWVWVKSRPFGYFNAKNKPLNKHEEICVFSDGTMANRSGRRMLYNPQGLVKVDQHWSRPQFYDSEHRVNRPSHQLDRIIEFTNYPGTILEYANSNRESLHPTQKPVDLLEYLVLTYSNGGDVVLDPFMGSGTTAVAAKQLGRHYFGCDINPEYVEMAQRRIAEVQLRLL